MHSQQLDLSKTLSEHFIDSNAATDVNYSVATLYLSWSSCIRKPERGIMELDGPQRLLPPFKGDLPSVKGRTPRFH